MSVGLVQLHDIHVSTIGKLRCSMQSTLESGMGLHIIY